VADGTQLALDEFPGKDGDAAAGLSGSLFADSKGFVSHPRIRPGAVEYRAFQVDIARKALAARLLAVLPTGMGKTVIAALVIAEHLRRGGRALVLAPTRPLCVQHRVMLSRFLRLATLALRTGRSKSAKVMSALRKADVVISTPQAARVDVEAGRLDIASFSLIVFDEAHRAVGEYDYVELSRRFREARPDGGVLGITASPGGERERIDEVVAALGVEAAEARSAESPDMAPYVKQVGVEVVEVTLPEGYVRVAEAFSSVLQDRITGLRRAGFLRDRRGFAIGKGALIACGQQILAQMAKTRHPRLFGAMLNQAVALHAAHCLELVDGQGAEPLLDYLARVEEKPKPTRSDRTFMNDKRVIEARAAATKLGPHPKLEALVSRLRPLLASSPSSLSIVFVQYRDTIDTVLARLHAERIDAARFVGQAHRKGDEGMSQAEQEALMLSFRAGRPRVMVASSVAEEGIDVPQVDLVVFYEPVASEVRAIQRRGRTGRARVGRVVVLRSGSARERGVHRASERRERRMRRIVQEMGASAVEAADSAAGPGGGDARA
jgi:Fanconi anemia group M protein